MTFYTLIGPADLPIPIWKTIAGHVSQQSWQLKVVGTFEHPETERKALPAVNDMLDHIQSETAGGGGHDVAEYGHSRRDAGTAEHSSRYAKRSTSYKESAMSMGPLGGVVGSAAGNVAVANRGQRDGTRKRKRLRSIGRLMPTSGRTGVRHRPNGAGPGKLPNATPMAGGFGKGRPSAENGKGIGREEIER